MTANDMEERLQSHYALLSRTIEFTRMADTKALPVILLNIALIGALSARFDAVLEILREDIFGFQWIIALVLTLSWAGSVVTAIGVAAIVYIPKTPLTSCSLIYFEDIASMNRDSFKEESRQLDSATIEGPLLDQIFQVSQIASAKMRRVRAALFLTIPSTLLAIALLAWGSL